MAPHRSKQAPAVRYLWINAPVAPAFKAEVDSLAARTNRSTAAVVRAAVAAYLADNAAGRKRFRSIDGLLDLPPRRRWARR